LRGFSPTSSSSTSPNLLDPHLWDEWWYFVQLLLQIEMARVYQFHLNGIRFATKQWLLSFSR
jgi:hypothetical protein